MHQSFGSLGHVASMLLTSAVWPTALEVVLDMGKSFSTQTSDQPRKAARKGIFI